MLQRLKKNGSQFSMRKLSNGEEKVYEANISLFDALKFTDSDKKGKFDLKRFIAAHCIILAIEGVPAFYFNSLFATKNDEKAFASSGIKRNLNRYKWDYSSLISLLNEKDSIEYNSYNAFKKLIAISPSDERPIKSILVRKPIVLPLNLPLLEALSHFTHGKARLGIVTNSVDIVKKCLKNQTQIPPNVHMAGIITMSVSISNHETDTAYLPHRHNV